MMWCREGQDRALTYTRNGQESNLNVVVRPTGRIDLDFQTNRFTFCIVRGNIFTGAMTYDVRFGR